MLKVYQVERELIAQTLLDIADTDSIKIAQNLVVCYALNIFTSSTLDFVDCLLIGYAKEEQYTVFTFDKKMQKYLSRLED